MQFNPCYTGLEYMHRVYKAGIEGIMEKTAKTTGATGCLVELELSPVSPVGTKSAASFSKSVFMQ